mmetsp:Transcript_11105/g.26677  ORF Transcript_11105/g.26677 Transcript_11105/m.26677 type:complete len:132 (-) Transcript_11105:227-622(-)
MVNPYPFQYARLTLTSITKVDPNGEEEQESKPDQPILNSQIPPSPSRPRSIVFDTMIEASRTACNIRRQQTIGSAYEDQFEGQPKQFVIHSQQTQPITSPSVSLVRRVTEFFGSSRSMESEADNDALFWCE